MTADRSLGIMFALASMAGSLFVIAVCAVLVVLR